MTDKFHKILNFMALFVVLLAVLFGFFHNEFFALASTNYVINGIIIGTALFGIGLCFHEMFRLLPEYNWLSKYTHGQRNLKLPPYILRPIASILQRRPCRIYADALSGLLDMVANRFNDARESIHYITGTLIFLGLLGTFWGLVITLGAFGELIGNINFDDVNILNSMQDGMSQPLAGMATAFTSSLLGLGASLIMGFLKHMVGRAHNTIFTELGDYMSAHTHTIDPNTDMIKRIDETIQRTNTAIENIEFNTSQKNV